MEMIKVSVIMPSLNVVDYIKQSLESVMAQTLGDTEILCIDAGSTDGTLETLKKYASRDSRIRVIESDKKSYGYQMNLGIKVARGKYIGIVETDDWIDPDMFEILFLRAEEKNADAVKGLPYDVYENRVGEYRELYIDYINDAPEFADLFSPEVHPEVHGWDGNIWNGIYNRDFLLNNKVLFNESPGAAFQDIGFQQMVLNEATRVLYVHNHFYHYRKVRTGASTWNPKCLRYLYTEYKRLFESGRIKANRNKWICVRLVSAFFHEFEKALLYSDFDENELECPEAVTWFRDVMEKAIGEGGFSKDLLNEERREKLDLLLSGSEKYIQEYKVKMKGSLSWTKDLVRRSQNEGIVVFGAGKYGLAMTLFLIRNGFAVYCIADNQPWIRNKSHYGIKIMSGDDAIRYYPYAVYIIANKHNAVEIDHQLELGGIIKDKRIIFDGSNAMLTDVIMKAPIVLNYDGN